VSAADRHRASNEACLDPETLALWVDDGLSAAERATAERHVADCARCQAALAALVRIAPAAERPRPWWRLSRVAWLAPLTAAAAALVIWIVVPGAPPPRSPAPSMRTSAPAPAPSSPQPAKEEAENKPEVAAKPPVVERRDEKRLFDKAPTSEVAAAPPSEVAPPPAPNASPAAAAPPPATAPAPPARTPSLDAFRASSGAAADAVARSAAQANVLAAEIISPDSMSRWRITGGRVIEHSTDGGATWQEQPTGATSALTAGSAPSPTICWVVGQGGVVLLSTDGRTWRRMGFPTTVDLVSVRATDERTATVTDANGRTYVTTDGGVTWTQRR